MLTPTVLLAALSAVLAQQSAGMQIRHFVDSVLTPAGIASAVLFVATVVVVAVARPLRWWALALLLYVVTLGVMPPREGVYLPPFAWPLETLRHQGRGLSGAFLIMLLLPAVLASKGWRQRVVGGAIISLFVFELAFSGRMLAAGFHDRALGGGVIFTLLFVVLGIGLGRWLQTPADVRTAYRAVAGSALLLLLGTLYQLAIDSAAALAGMRLMGTTANPQVFASTSALVLPPIIYLLLHPSEPKMLRAAYAAITGLLLIFLVWTGSRTGTLMAMIGLGVTFRFRLGKKLVGVGLACGVFVILALQVFSESRDVAGRLLSLEDTRTAQWNVLLSDFSASPMFGRMEGDVVSVGENSYLTTAARYGVFGLALLAVLMAMTATALLRLQRRRGALGEDAMLADVATGGIVALGAGSMFEAFLLGTLSFSISYLYLQLTVVAFLLDWTGAKATQVLAVSDEHAWGHDEYQPAQLMDADSYVQHAGDAPRW